MPQEKLTEFKSAYLEIAKQLKKIQQQETNNAPPEVQQLDFELVLFASALIDYDYIMRLLSKYTQQNPQKVELTPEQLIRLLSSSANLMEEKKEIQEYIHTLQVGKGLSEQEVKENYQLFKAKKNDQQLTHIAQEHGLSFSDLKQLVETTLSRGIFDAEALNPLFATSTSWKDRKNKETKLMKDLIPYLKKQAEGKEISGLKAYEQE
ncbi:MAG: hypothetical protein NZM38_05960 [Cytophagales bacterium]|nr:hypothetical protein [Cytophagales bacterium]MDW8384300.1 hypothetical protein [Flammeovirgaceae bacterium]